MATNSNWTIVFEDKTIIKQNNDGAAGYTIDDNSFWNDSKWSNIWAIQYKNDNLDYNDCVEYRDDTPHSTWNNANLGDFRTQFIDKWDSEHLTQLQSDWDSNNVDGETDAEKITRLGARPTSYSS
tara:strand:- start:101 stop:475 length:375 start_codon:yes stop_codon:yes gene_type:complete